MRVSEKLDLIDKVGRELQSRFTYREIDIFLAEFGVHPPDNVYSNSKWVYSKTALTGVSDEIIIKIAEELDLEVRHTSGSKTSTPRNWSNTSELRVFISHISKHKDKATRLKECLSRYGMSGFVAHEDIHPTLEWQGEIERALHTMDAFVAIHTPGFSQSIWTQQEIGFAVGRGTKIVSLKMGEDPTGFISKQQALARRGRTAEAIAEEIDALLAEDPRTSQRLADAKRAHQPKPSDEIPF